MFLNKTLQECFFVVVIISVQELRDYPGNYAESSCTGSLIREDLVLTAAHCFRNKSMHNPTQATIKLLSGTVRKSNEIIVHPKFSHDGYDLAVLTHPSVGTGPFPDLPISNLTTNQSCISAGYGNSLVLKVLPVDLSKSFLGRFKTYFSVRFLDISPCHGDSGGPLLCGETLCGVLSRGSVVSCVNKGGTVLYEDVFLNLNWIQQFLDRPIIPYQNDRNWILYIILAVFLVILIVSTILLIICF